MTLKSNRHLELYLQRIGVCHNGCEELRDDVSALYKIRDTNKLCFA
jgi:hypothetical protein